MQLLSTCHPGPEPGSMSPGVITNERVHGLRIKPAMTCESAELLPENRKWKNGAHDLSGLSQRNVLRHWHFLGSPLQVKRAAKVARFQPLAQ